MRRGIAARTTLLLIASLALAGCGGANGSMEVSSPMTAEDVRVLDNGVDFIADANALAGQWLEGWSEEMDLRIGRADLICVVEVQAMHTDTDLERHTSHRLAAHVLETLRGAAPDEIALNSHRDDAGYPTLERGADRVLEGRFVAFVKWIQPGGEDTPIYARWHLSPDSEAVRTYVDGRLAVQQQGEGRSRRRDRRGDDDDDDDDDEAVPAAVNTEPAAVMTEPATGAPQEAAAPAAPAPAPTPAPASETPESDDGFRDFDDF